MFTKAQKKIFSIVLKNIGLHKDVCDIIYNFLNEHDLFVLAHAIGFQNKLALVFCNKHIDFIHEDGSPFFPDKFGVYCASKGYGKLIEYFDVGELYSNKHSDYYSDKKNNPFISSLKNKHYDIAKRLYERGKVSFKTGESRAIGEIEDIATFKFFMKIYQPDKKYYTRYVSEAAAASGLIENLKHLQLLEWKFDRLILSEAAANNRKETFDWIEKEIFKGSSFETELSYGTDTLCRHLSYLNNIEMLRHIHSRGYIIGEEIMYSANSAEIVAFGIELGMEVDIPDYLEYGKVEILKYLSANGYNIPNNINTFISAINSLTHEFVQWLIDRNCPGPGNVTITLKESPSVKFVSLILSLYPWCEWKGIEYIRDVEILKMLNCPLNTKLFTYQSNNFEILKYGLTKYPNLFTSEIESSSIEILIWLDKKFPNKRNFRTAYIACIRNQFRLVKWLYYNNYPFDFPELYQSLYHSSDTTIFRWLYLIHPLPKETLLSYEPKPEKDLLSFEENDKSYNIRSWIESL